MEAQVGRWFFQWLRLHKRLCPHQKWGEYEGRGTEEVARTYAGWIAEFEQAGATKEVAELASERLQKRHPGFPEHHLQAVLAEIRDIQAEDRREAERERRARARREAAELAAAVAEQASRFGALTEAERAACMAEAAAENPYLERWPELLKPLAYEVMDRRRGVVRYRRD